MASNRMQKVERHLTSVHTTSFFFPTSKIETILEFGINGDCLFYLAYDYGKMKPCRKQRESRQVFPYRFLHGFILLQAKETYIYKDKILWTRKHTDSCTRQVSHRCHQFFLRRHCNGCAGQRQMTMAGTQVTSCCLATCWREWHLQPERARDSEDRSRFPQVRRSTPKNRFPLNGTWAGSAYATCWTHSRTWGLSTLAVQGWHP